jgi:hypothetical protein
MSRRTTALSIAIGSVALTGTAVAAIGGLGEQVADPPSAEPPVDRVDPSVGDLVATVNRPPGAGDEVPPGPAAFVDRMRTQGANIRLSRRSLRRDRLAVFLIPARDGLCYSLVDEQAGASLSCRSVAELAEGPAPAGALVQDHAVLYGVVPDGVQSVRVDLASGSAISRPVEGNAYLVELAADADPVSLSYLAPSGDRVKRPAVVPRPEQVAAG